jgi:predicted dehydrogenase
MKDKPVLIVGLGSMGKRRVRNLQALGFSAVAGFDLRADRREEAGRLYGIKTFRDFDEAVSQHRPAALIISVPPDVHQVYMNKAIGFGIPFFVEASVTDHGMEEIIRRAREKKVFAAPSSTMYFHPAIRAIMDIVKSGYLGKLSNVIYHMGNYLPDWHTYEKVSDFYVSKKETGGAREIVPFELTWLVKLFDFPEQVCATFKKTIDIEGAPDIDDTYNVLMDYGRFTLVLTVDVVTRSAIRRMLINGSEKELIWNWDDNCIRIFHHDKQEWETREYEMLSAEAGYNKNITEQMYIDEMQAFFNGISNPASYVNTLEDDHRVLKLLYTIEESWTQKKFMRV